MLPVQAIHSLDQIKLLSDPRRLAILRLLMSAPASLSQLGASLGEHPAWVRHHLKQLEAVGLVELVETRLTAGVVEKFYRARAGGFLFQELLLPQDPAHPVIVFSGSHDLALEYLARRLAPHLSVLAMPVGSLDGLVSLRQKLCHFSGCHLLDETGEYNLPFIRHFFPDHNVQVITLAFRQQGLMVAQGNPLGIHTLADLVRPDVNIINRNPGSGTRLWFDRQLQVLNIPPSAIHGYGNTAATHTHCARLIQDGTVNAAIGLHAAAMQYNLDFIPLFTERYDLVLPQEQMETLTPLLDQLQTSAFRRGVAALVGYETAHTGEQIPF